MHLHFSNALPSCLPQCMAEYSTGKWFVTDYPQLYATFSSSTSHFLIEQTVSSKRYVQSAYCHWQTHYECKCSNPSLSQAALTGANLSNHKRNSSQAVSRVKVELQTDKPGLRSLHRHGRRRPWWAMPLDRSRRPTQKRRSLTPQRLIAREQFNVLIHSTTFKVLHYVLTILDKVSQASYLTILRIIMNCSKQNIASLNESSNRSSADSFIVLLVHIKLRQHFSSNFWRSSHFKEVPQLYWSVSYSALTIWKRVWRQDTLPYDKQQNLAVL